MEFDIEALDRQRMLYLRWNLIGFVPFLLLSITRFLFRQSGLNSSPIGAAVLAGLLVSLLVITISTIGTLVLGNMAKGNPALKDALNNEMIRSLEVGSWKAAFLGAIAVTIFFALASFFYPVSDPVMVALTSVITGAGAYQANFYFRYKAS